MSEYDERHQQLREQVAAAQTGLAELPNEQRQNAAEELKRLEEALGFTATLIDLTDPELVSDAAHNALGQQIQALTAQVADAAANPRPYTEQLLGAVAALPADPREIEASKVKESAANFQRSAQQRLNALVGEIEKAHGQAREISSELEARRQEIAGLIEHMRQEQDQQTAERLAAIEQRVDEIRAAAEQHAQRVDALVTEQTEAFRNVQDERAEEHREREKEFETRIADLETKSRERVEALVREIESMKTKSAELVGAIGVTGTAERYGEEFTNQQKAADRWRRVTVMLGGLAVIVALLAAFDNKASTAGAKLAIAVLLGGVAAYTARQSARHRRREERARQLQLDLTAFPVFIEALPPEDRHEETVRMVRRSFLGARTATPDDDEPGPGPLSQFVRRRRGAPDDPNDQNGQEG